MGGPRQPRLPWADLWAYANGRGISTMTGLARRCGVDVRDLHRWRVEGGVPERSADRVAVALDDVPENVWGSAAWADATANLTAKAAAAEAIRHKKTAATKRRYRQNNPDYAARQRAKTQRWKAENPERVRRYHAEYQRQWRARQGPEFFEARAAYQRAYKERRKAAS